MEAAQEKLRLEVLDSYKIMDTAPEPGFDRITGLAARLCGVPMAFLTLVDAKRVFFKSSHGLTLHELPRTASICQHTFGSSGVLAIRDTRADPVYAANPMVTGPPHVRFYASATLWAAQGQPIGTLSVVDRVPRPDWDGDSERVLQDLADTVVALLDARLREHELAAAGTTARLHANLLRLSFEAPDWPTMIRAVLARICAAHRARAGSVWRQLPDGHVQMAEYHVAGAPLPEPFIAWCRRARPRTDETLMGRAMLEERRFAHDFSADELGGMPVLQACRDVGLNAIVVQPVNLGERRFALTLLFERARPDLQAVGERLAELADTLRPAMFRHVAEEQQRQLRGALDAASDSVLVMEAGPTGRAAPRILYASAAVSRMTGWRQDEIVGATPALFFGPGTGRRQLAALRRAVRTGRKLRTELLGYRRDGSMVWVESEIATLADSTGVAAHVISIQRDITQRRADEAALRERNRAFRLIFEDAPLPILIFEESTLRVLAANAAAERLYGWSPDEFRGLTVADLRPAGERAGLPAELAARGDGYRRTDPLRHVTRSGEAVQVQIASQPIRFEGRRARIAVVADITELRNAQEALLQSERLSTIGQITGGVAHDFNNLLTVVMLNLADALEQVPAAGPLHGMLDAALYAAGRGAELTRQLLAYARRQDLRPQIIALQDQLGRFAPLLSRALGERHRLETAFGGADPKVSVDPLQLETAVMNLVLNARDALPAGGVIRLGVASRVLGRSTPAIPDAIAPGRYASVFVEDHGSGIAEANLRRVFDPFFTTKPSGEGSGLGLSMVYGFVRQSGGHVDLHSTTGHGTRVELLLPQAAEAGRAPSSQAAGGFRADGMSVLLVEDQEPVLRVVSRHFAGFGFRVLTAASAEAAVPVLQGGERLDLLFSDVVLPGDMNGTALAALALRLRPGLRVLLTSGYPGDSLGEAGRFSLLRKPYLRRDLVASLEGVFAAAVGGAGAE